MSTFPPGPLTPLGATLLAEGIDEHLWFTDPTGEHQFYLKGPLAPIAPGLPGQDGIVIQSTSGLTAPFKHIDLQAAHQDGVTNTGTVYDPAKITLQGEMHATTAQGLDKLRDTWQGAWDPRNPGTLEYITPDGGYWYAKARLESTWADTIKADRRYLYRPMVHKCRLDDSFWSGPDSSDAFAPSYASVGENFTTDSPGNLSGSWNTNYSGGHTGTVKTATGVGAYWFDPGGNSNQSAECISTTATVTDFQIITIQLGGAWEGITLGGFASNRIWGHVDGSGNAVMCDIGNTGVYVYRFNSGTPTLMWYRPLLFPPLPNETWTFVIGADLSNPRSYALFRSGWHVTILGLFTIGFGGEVLRFNEFGANSVVGSGARGVGFGMTTVGGLLGAPPANPIPVASFSAGDNTAITETGHIQLSNIGTQEGWPSYTLTGPGTFGIGNGPASSAMITIGPLGYGQIAQVTTLPRLRSVVDAANPAVNLYPLMAGRFTNPIPGVAVPSQASPVHIPVSITGGSAISKIVATLTPRRIHPA